MATSGIATNGSSKPRSPRIERKKVNKKSESDSNFKKKFKRIK